ncbi:PIN domain-containing protein [Micromonospora sp. NPDC051141]|uniref:PIN domain-containing protein n=1 Tax=Micromonospora sp. NPDC051141 TaxID=3364284 RepID=UPI00378E2DE1
MIVAVLDACVLVPSVLADTLLRCAEQGLYRPLWTQEILDEVRRNLPPSVLGAKAERRVEVMREHFPTAMVSGYEHLIAEMVNDRKDRHVLAAAVAADAELIVTANLRDFPDHALAPYAIEVLHPDDFLCMLLDDDPERITDIVVQQAEATGRGGRPKLSADDVLSGLAGCRAIRFAHRVSLRLAPGRWNVRGLPPHDHHARP